jgi:hypothetical protein
MTANLASHASRLEFQYTTLTRFLNSPRICRG